ncbi:MAG TPA: hypothetical protein VEO53_03935, partial [Candidatus Binatia bacterium]|nr:hypothetical protein [Candidatus Binatia bacterium]
MESDLAASGPDHQITVGVDSQGRCLLRPVGRGKPRPYGYRDRLRISAWSDHEVIFELPLVAVIDQVDTGI